MQLEKLALGKTGDLPIRHEGTVHNGKVRSVYWLTKEDNRRLIELNSMLYGCDENAQLGVMVISDKISAFDCNWQGEGGLQGVPGKGAALNAISEYWFSQIQDVARNHLLESPHPLVWIVQRAEPIMIEAIARQYITGSMWRDYERGTKVFGGVTLPDGLKQHQELPELLITPTTKGILRGIPGVPETDDVNITREQIDGNYAAFGFKFPEDIKDYETLLRKGFGRIKKLLRETGQIFVDTKFEFGYVRYNGQHDMIYIDEIGTPDSSRMWDAAEYENGRVVENSKEGFRQFLLKQLDRDVLLNGARMAERKKLAETYKVPVTTMEAVSSVYTSMAELITGQPIPNIENPREEILEVLSGYNLIK